MPGVPVFAHRQLAFNKRKDTLYIANSAGHTIVRYSLKSNSGIAWCGLNSVAGYADANLTASRFNFPMGIVRSDSGWVVCDNSNKRLRLISFSGRVKTFAGIGLIPDGIGENSRFLEPYDIVKHPKKDTIYITDRGNHCIRQIDLRTQTVKTIVGNGNPGNIYGIGENAVLTRPFNMAISETGDSLYFTEPFSNKIKLLLTKTREVKLLAGADVSGYLDSTNGRLAKFNQPQDIALKGNILYVADSRNQRIRAVNVLTSRVTTFAGSGSTVTGGFKDSTLLFSRFNRPISLEWVGNKLFIGEDAGLRIRVLYPDSGKVKVWAGCGNIVLQDGVGTAA
jgi:DNA-binding beta-propeller fold protein YncE